MRVTQDVAPHVMSGPDVSCSKEVLREESGVRLPPSGHVQFSDPRGIGERGLSECERHQHIMPEPPVSFCPADWGSVRAILRMDGGDSVLDLSTPPTGRLTRRCHVTGHDNYCHMR